MSRKELKMSKEKIKLWEKREMDRLTISMTLNSLETEVINMKSNLDQVVYKKFSTSEERAKILQKCEEISDWLENQLEYNDNADNLQNMALIRKKEEEFNSVAMSLSFKVKQFQTDTKEVRFLKLVIDNKLNWSVIY